ncbi:MAG: T9SS type A sorting domain-containing protein [Bacteroidetes bacterium]|nr:T9SS type A sorting domain-containing protein [Bacteroidota bacterium]
MRKYTIGILFLVSLISVTKAQDSIRFLSATTGAACQVIQYYDSCVITGTGSTLRVYDSRTGVPYPILWEYWYQSQITDMAISGHYLFVAANYECLTKWDISDPANPTRVFDILPDSGLSFQDISLSGDTIFLSQFYKMSVYKDFGNSWSKITDYGNTYGWGFITGADVKNGVCAHSVSFNLGITNGVYFFNTHTFSQLSFYHQTKFYPENVIWGENNNLLHVLGGTNTVDGYFYSLDATNPSSPQLVYEDSLKGFIFGIAIANPYNAVNINDTIYVATWCALDENQPLPDHCNILAYDATDPQNIGLVAYIPAGLWHFDLAINQKKMYIASEWYGIKTVDFSQIDSTIDLGNTLTGGWNTGSDKFGNMLAVANEGYGFKMYDISNPADPVLRAINNDPGFCGHIRFSPDGQHVYTFNNSTQCFRVYRSDSLIQTGYIVNPPTANKRTAVFGDRVYGYYQFLDSTKLNIVNVSNPAAPFLETFRVMQINDMLVSVDGKLFVANNDSIFVYDVSGGQLTKLSSVTLAGTEDATALAFDNTYLYAYIKGRGLTRYTLTENAGVWQFNQICNWTITQGDPHFIAVDDLGLYMAFKTKGLYAFDKTTGVQKAWYKTGLDYRKFIDQYGIQALFCKDSLIVTVEYFSQTSLLTMYNDYQISIDPVSAPMEMAMIYPNPASDEVWVKVAGTPGEKVQVQILDCSGRLVMRIEKTLSAETEVIRLPISEIKSGVYIVKTNGCARTGKLVIKR